MTALVLEILIKSAVLIGGLMTAAAYFVLLERRMAAWTQDRIGPSRVGAPLSLFGFKDLRLWGLGQPAADGLKMMLKEDYTPAHVDRKLYILAPLAILAAAVAVSAVIPFGSVLPPMTIGGEKVGPIHLVVAPGVDVGMIYVFALSSIAVYGVILGGWASNNKYSFIGGLRSSAQLIAYELPMGLGILGVVLAAGSLDLERIMDYQANYGWFALAQPLGFIVFLVAAFAEAARLPFDLPEAEQELIGGYHTEYAGMKLLLFLVAEFLHMIVASFLIVILFFGGWHLPIITGDTDAATVTWFQAIARIVVLHSKIFLVIVFFMWVRWSWPRFRFDQLMNLAWKIMLPLGLANFVAIAILYELRKVYDPTESSFAWTIGIIAASWIVFALAWLATSLSNPLVTDNRPRGDLSAAGVDSQMKPDDPNIKWIEEPKLGLAGKMYLPLVADGLTTTFKHLAKSLRGETVTISYPDEEPKIGNPQIYRGVHRLNKDQAGRVKCVACFLCATACPAHCIDIIAEPSPWPDREKYPQSFSIDELRCIYCGMCEEACPVDAIELTSLYNLTGRSREEMIFDKEKLLSVYDMTKDKEPMQSPALGGTAT